MNIFISGVKRYAICAFALVLATLSLSAHASNCSIPTPVLSMPASLTVDDNASVGSIIGTWSYSTMNINCYKDKLYEWQVFHRLYTSLPVVAGITIVDGGVTYNVYASGTPGVGIAMGFQNVDQGNAWENLTTDQATNAYSVSSNQIRYVDMITNMSGGTYNTAAQFKVAFVKTGEVRTGFTTNQTIINYYPVWYYRQYSSGSPLLIDTSSLVYANLQVSPVQFKVVPPTCTTNSDTANLAIQLQAAFLRDFTGVGSTTKPMPFNINLSNCYKNPKVTMSLTGTADPDYPAAAANGVLKVVGGTATGVGVQLLGNAGGTPVPFALNQDVVIGTVNGNGKTDSFTFPMIARYIQTNAKVAAGSVNATATINLTYN